MLPRLVTRVPLSLTTLIPKGPPLLSVTRGPWIASSHYSKIRAVGGNSRSHGSVRGVGRKPDPYRDTVY